MLQIMSSAEALDKGGIREQQDDQDPAMLFGPPLAVLPDLGSNPGIPERAPLTEYEEIRESNIAEIERLFLCTFGRPFNRSRAIQLGELVEEEDELDNQVRTVMDANE
jgi:hypothetical protein